MLVASLLTCTLALQTQELPTQQRLPAGMVLASQLKSDFNKAKGKVKLMFIFSPS